MANIGVLCDDPNHYGEKYSFDECLRCSQTGGPRRCHAPTPHIHALTTNTERRKDAGISATMLGDCARKIALSAEHDFYVHPAGEWAKFRGTLAHALMESYDPEDPNIVQEVRFKRAITVDVDGEDVEIWLTGQIDFLDRNRHLIIDYKSIGSLSKVKQGPKPEHGNQLNTYAWLIADGTVVSDGTGRMKPGDRIQEEILGLGLCYFDMSAYMKHGTKLWDPRVTEAYIRERIEPIARWRKTQILPDVLPDERGKRNWKCNPKWCPLRTHCDARVEGTIGPGDDPPTVSLEELDGANLLQLFA